MIANKLQLSAVDDAGSSMPRPSLFQSAVRRRELLLTTAMTLLFSTNSQASSKAACHGSLMLALHLPQLNPGHGRTSLQKRALLSRRSSTG